MKSWMLAAACLMIAGCDYTVPLAKTPVGDADPALAGLWRRPLNDRTENLLVLPLSPREWMVAYPAASPDAMYARAWPAGPARVQLQWIGTGKGNRPENDRVYQLADFSIAGDTLTIRVINAKVAGANAASPEELARAVEANKDDPGFYQEAMVFKRVKD
jgi:hypothetical protein